jgi:glycosyltransferase involved in cell wall biosynthesis
VRFHPDKAPHLAIKAARATAKRDLFARAACLIFPICWDEPFGLVMAEAIACGTPVVAPRRDAVPEIVVSGRTGIEASFTVRAMAAGYEATYRRALAEIATLPDGPARQAVA